MKTLSSISADPRTRIQWPWWGALLFCVAFGVVGTIFLHAGHAERHASGTSWCFFTLVLGGALAVAARDMSRVPECLLDPDPVPLAIVHRLPRSIAFHVDPMNHPQAPRVRCRYGCCPPSS